MAAIEKIQSLEDLKRHFNMALQEVRGKLTAVQSRYAASFETIREYLEINEPSLIESLDLLGGENDNDIFGKVADGRASPEECADWFRGVQDWKHLFLEGISRFENFQILSRVA